MIHVRDLAGSQRGRAALVVGNGESRMECDLGAVREEILVLGCNALYRDFIPDYLGAVDERMTDEIVRAFCGQGFAFLGPEGRVEQWLRARTDLPELIVSDLPDDWTTGPMMVQAAAILGCEPIYLLGFDLGWTPRPGRVNDVYRDTRGYGTSEDDVSCHAERWPAQLESILRTYPDRRILQIGPSTLPIAAAAWGGLIR